jgi:hypothetical protein
LAAQYVWARRSIIALVGDVLSEHRRALTLVGGQAVILRTIDRHGVNLSTEDADFALTPSLVASDPRIEDALTQAGFVPRSDSRPGLWGRSPYTSPTGRTAFAERIDLDVPAALSGNESPRRRSVAATLRHGRGAATVARGLELAVYDRSLMTVSDLEDPALSVEVYVAGVPALIMAKAFKIGERLFDSGRYFRDKDAADLFALMGSAAPAAVAETFSEYSDDPAIGVSVQAGIAYLVRLLADAGFIRTMREAVSPPVPPAHLGPLVQSWREAFS